MVSWCQFRPCLLLNTLLGVQNAQSQYSHIACTHGEDPTGMTGRENPRMTMGMMTAVGPASTPSPLFTRMKGKGKGVRPVLWGLSIHRMGYGYWKGSDDCGSRKRTLKSAHLVLRTCFRARQRHLERHFSLSSFCLIPLSSRCLSQQSPQSAASRVHFAGFSAEMHRSLAD